MNDEHVEEELLQRYFDGALEQQSAARVEQHLGTCAACEARRRALGKLKRAIGIAAEQRAGEVDFEALFSRIEVGVRERPHPGFGERLSMAWSNRLEQRARQMWLPAAGAVAAAAALLLFLRSVPPSEQPAAPGADDAAQGATSRLSSTSSEVEQVDFGTKAGTVFDIALSEGISTPVVWIDDDDDESGE